MSTNSLLKALTPLLFRGEVDQIVKATAKYYGKTLNDLRTKRHEAQNEARVMVV